jgi:hypothetical protein
MFVVKHLIESCLQFVYSFIKKTSWSPSSSTGNQLHYDEEDDEHPFSSWTSHSCFNWLHNFHRNWVFNRLKSKNRETNKYPLSNQQQHQQGNHQHEHVSWKS